MPQPLSLPALQVVQALLALYQPPYPHLLVQALQDQPHLLVLALLHSHLQLVPHHQVVLAQQDRLLNPHQDQAQHPLLAHYPHQDQLAHLEVPQPLARLHTVLQLQ